MKKSLHYQRILKRVVARLWDNLSGRERETIASDVTHETELYKWFNATVLAEAKAKYESPTYWMNDEYSFKYVQKPERE